MEIQKQDSCSDPEQETGVFLYTEVYADKQT